MSFGYSVGDFVLLVQLAHKTFRNCQKAGEEYIEIACEVRCLHSVLRILRSESQKPESKIFSQDQAAIAQLIETADGCKKVLDNLDYILKKYEGLKIDGQKSASKKIWHRFRFRSKVEELGAIRGKLVICTSTISILIDTLQINATNQVQKKVDGGFADVTKQMSGQFERMRKEIYAIASEKRAEERRGAMISTLSLSTYAGDETAVWQDFRKELVSKGFRSSSLESHKYILQAYMLKLDQSGLLDKDNVLAPDATDKISWWAKKTYMENVNSIAEEPLSSDTPADQETLKINKEDGIEKKEWHEEAQERTAGFQSTAKKPLATGSAAQKLSVLTWVQESVPTSQDSIPDEYSHPASSTSASSVDTEVNDESFDNGIPAKGFPALNIAVIQSISKIATSDAKDSDSGDVISRNSPAFEWLTRESQDVKTQKRPKAHVRDEADEEELEIETESDAVLTALANSCPTAEDGFFMQNPTISPPPPALSLSITEQGKETIRVARRPKAIHIETADDVLHKPNSPMTRNLYDHSTGETLSIDGAISIDGNSVRHRQKDGEQRRISSRSRDTLEAWNSLGNFPENRINRDSEHLSSSRPRSIPVSPMRRSARKIHEISSKSRHSRSRSIPISPLRPVPPEVHQSATKVHYRGSAIEIVDFPSSQRMPATERIPLPRKSILKQPTERFPEDPNPVQEGVAPLKDAKMGGIPADARWTKISRTIVNPEALEAGKERYEARNDDVVVLRVLGRAEIDAYAEVTQRIRAMREREEIG